MPRTSASVGTSPAFVLLARSRSDSSFEPERPAERSFSSELRRMRSGVSPVACGNSAHSRAKMVAAALPLKHDRLGERAEHARRALQQHAERPDARDQPGELRVCLAQLGHGRLGIEGEAAERFGLAAAGALDGQQPQLGGDAAVGREPADPAVRGEHAMARHDDRERILAERLPDGARRAGRAQLRRELSV
jgi:hypothetical protein